MFFKKKKSIHSQMPESTYATNKEEVNNDPVEIASLEDLDHYSIPYFSNIRDGNVTYDPFIQDGYMYIPVLVPRSSNFIPYQKNYMVVYEKINLLLLKEYLESKNTQESDEGQMTINDVIENRDDKIDVNEDTSFLDGPEHREENIDDNTENS